MHTIKIKAGGTLLSVSLLSCLGSAVWPFAAAGQSSQETQTWNVAAGSLDQALRRLMTQGRLTISYPPELVAGKTTRGVSGQHAAAEALRRLLTDTGIGWDALNETTFVLRKATPGGAATATPRPPQQYERAGESQEAAVTDLSGVAVTGTRIRGGTTPSPVTTIGVERIREEGFTDLGEVIRNVPQNFSGGQNPGIVGGAEGGGIANQNISGGSALNLRGLGPDATLTLLNGRRLAYSGFVQAVDIDAIPIDAIDRLEIIPDGASAIYGSDAVGGVGNVILKRDYEGVTVGTRYGAATDGGLATRQYTATAGTQWFGGGMMATWMKASSDPIYSDQRDYADYLFGPTTLYPQSDLYSGLLSFHQSLGSGITLQLDALRTEREQLAYYTAIESQFYPATSDTKTSFVSPSIEVSLSDWKLSIGGAWGKDDIISGLSIGSRATGALTPLSPILYRNKSRSHEVGAEGPLFDLPGGAARLALGVGSRTNEFQQSSGGIVSDQGDDSSRFAYAEINLPLIGGERAISGVRRLTLTAAVRGEDYDSFGRVTTPRLGVIYGPSADFTLKASWGKSFKVPTLLQRNQTLAAFLYPAATVGGRGYPADATVLMPYGGNPDLQPERATTWSASMAIHPQALPAFEAELSWFDIDFSGRIAQPLNQAEALNSPLYAQFVDYFPTAEQQASIIAAAQFSNFTGAPYDPAQVVAIAFNRYINTIAQHVRGLDLSGSYRIDLDAGRLQVRGALSWLDSSQQTTTAAGAYDMSGTLFYPAKLKGRIGAVWNQGGVTASTFANYISGVTNTVDARKGGSFTTLDATLRYATDVQGGFFSGLDLALSATNILGRSPPLYTPASARSAPYDSTNYSAIGRFLSISVSKQW